MNSASTHNPDLTLMGPNRVKLEDLPQRPTLPTALPSKPNRVLRLSAGQMEQFVGRGTRGEAAAICGLRALVREYGLCSEPRIPCAWALAPARPAGASHPPSTHPPPAPPRSGPAVRVAARFPFPPPPVVYSVHSGRTRSLFVVSNLSRDTHGSHSRAVRRTVFGFTR